MLYLFDIDGTLADASHRLPLITQPKPDWDAFYIAADKDTPIWETITIARALDKSMHRIIMVSGRSEIIREATVVWLRKYRVPFECVYMRGVNDHREDTVVKSEILDWLIAANPKGEKIGGVFEDRQQCVDMYRARGLRVFQVAEGNF